MSVWVKGDVWRFDPEGGEAVTGDPDATRDRVRELEAARAEVVRRARAGEPTVGEAWEEVRALPPAAPEVAAMRARL